jgi:hypothetical protein
MKHRSATTVHRAGDGTTTWRLPAGQVYTCPPRPVLARALARPGRTPGTAALPPLPPEQPHTYDTGQPGWRALRAALDPAATGDPTDQRDPRDDRYLQPPPF